MVVVGESDEEEERQHLLSQTASPVKVQPEQETGEMQREEADKE